jgi:hypothetical protein
MRNLSLFFLLATLLAACATTETGTEETAETAATSSPVPGWFDDRISSRSDSLVIEGIAMASALDSAKAVGLSAETALQNLKLGIDREVDEVRKELANNSAVYGSTRFIISLRQAVAQLQLQDLEAETAHDKSDSGTHYVYTRYRVQKSRLPELLSSAGLQDPSFLQQISEQ